MQNDRARHDEYLLDLDQVACCGQLSNLSSDFPLGSRKFSSYYSLYMPINLFYELNKYEDISYADLLMPWGGQRPPRTPLIDAHAVPV